MRTRHELDIISVILNKKTTENGKIKRRGEYFLYSGPVRQWASKAYKLANFVGQNCLYSNTKFWSEALHGYVDRYFPTN